MTEHLDEIAALLAAGAMLKLQLIGDVDHLARRRAVGLTEAYELSMGGVTAWPIGF
jgi:hypothetical protein